MGGVSIFQKSLNYKLLSDPILKKKMLVWKEARRKEFRGKEVELSLDTLVPEVE